MPPPRENTTILERDVISHEPNSSPVGRFDRPGQISVSTSERHRLPRRVKRTGGRTRDRCARAIGGKTGGCRCSSPLRWCASRHSPRHVRHRHTPVRAASLVGASLLRARFAAASRAPPDPDRARSSVPPPAPPLRPDPSVTRRRLPGAPRARTGDETPPC